MMKSLLFLLLFFFGKTSFIVAQVQQTPCFDQNGCPDDNRCSCDGTTLPCSGFCDPTRNGLFCPAVEGVNNNVCTTNACCNAREENFECTVSQISVDPVPPPCEGCGCVARRCGGLDDLSCPVGTKCIRDPGNNCDPMEEAFCTGICVEDETTPPSNGQCPTDLIGPNRNIVCTDNNCCASATFSCQASQQAFGPGPLPCQGCGCIPKSCAGPANIQCPIGTMCIDNPNCDPGDDDCTGICVDPDDIPEDPEDDPPEDITRPIVKPFPILFPCPRPGPNVEMFSKRIRRCKRKFRKFKCSKPGSTRFQSVGCGCGCVEPTPDECPVEREGSVAYNSRDFERCRLTEFGCGPPLTERFNIEGCGCGCALPGAIDTTPAPICQRPGRRYISRDVERCKSIRIRCRLSQRPFSDECGCGCEKKFGF